MCLTVYLSVRLCVCVYVCLSFSFYPFYFLFPFLSICLLIYFSLSVSLFLHTFVHKHTLCIPCIHYSFLYPSFSSTLFSLFTSWFSLPQYLLLPLSFMTYSFLFLGLCTHFHFFLKTPFIKSVSSSLKEYRCPFPIFLFLSIPAFHFPSLFLPFVFVFFFFRNNDKEREKKRVQGET